MNAIVLDCETTGVDEPDVIQLAWLPLVSSFEGAPKDLIMPGAREMQKRDGRDYGLSVFKPRKPISLGAMATHHIIEADLVDSPAWPGGWELPPATEYVVGHNVDFDWEAIGKPECRRICTLALARKLWPDLDSHSLGAMTYHTMPNQSAARSALRNAHGALTDCWLTHRLLLAELALMPKIASWERLYEASERARVPTHFTFGKFEGRPLSEIGLEDPGYIRWCLEKCDQCQDPYWQAALKAVI